jgi:hypothetical protein
MDEWPPIKCERFDGESLESYSRRASEVKEIIQGFRSLRFRGDLAEQKERRLIELQEPHLQHHWN